jgi:hypothetical protein
MLFPFLNEMVRNEILSISQDDHDTFFGRDSDMQQPDHSRMRAILHRLLAWIKRSPRKEPEPPAVDPYAYVTAPKRPRMPNRSGAAVAELPEE